MSTKLKERRERKRERQCKKESEKAVKLMKTKREKPCRAGRINVKAAVPSPEREKPQSTYREVFLGFQNRNAFAFQLLWISTLKITLERGKKRDTFKHREEVKKKLL
jgi:hypothetical protein